MAVGDLVGPYQVLALLGSGGMGEVFRARDTRLEREVALKLIAPAAAELSLARFAREGRLLAALSHPNVVAVFDVGEHLGQPFIVSELLEGQTLRERLERGPPPAELAQRWSLELAQGLGAAHARGIVHRDLKPENVVATRGGTLKIIDFGIATDRAVAHRTLPGGKASTGAGELLGTPGYMSPEQLRGEPADLRSDVFTLGCVLFEICAGGRPFGGGTPVEAAAAVLHREPAPLPATTPPALARVIARCLQKDPSGRFADAREVAFALGGALPPRRLRLGLAVGTCVALAAAALALVAARRPQPAPPAAIPAAISASIAVLPFADLSPTHNLEYFADGLVDELLNVLAHLGGLRVAGRTSSFSFKGKGEDLREVARKLGVGAVLEGSVRASGDRVRITAQLINAADGFHLWSQTFERKLSDAFGLQDEIAAAVAEALKLHLQIGYQARSRPANAEAYKHFLMGKSAYATATPDGHRRALELFARAVELEPSYGRAWASLAIVTATTAAHAPTPAARDDGARRALALADKAISLAPDLAEAYAARAQLRADYFHLWQEALADSARALALSPEESDVLLLHGRLLIPVGRLAEARATLQKVEELDPLNFGAYLFHAIAEIYLGNTVAAREVLRRLDEIRPSMRSVPYWASVSYLVEGKPDEAAAVGRTSQVAHLRDQVEAMAAHAGGHGAEAQRALAALEAVAVADDVTYQAAQASAFLGERDRAFGWLERAFERRDDMLPYANVDPLLRGLRGDPRFREVLRRVHLEAQ